MDIAKGIAMVRKIGLMFWSSNLESLATREPPISFYLIDAMPRQKDQQLIIGAIAFIIPALTQPFLSKAPFKGFLPVSPKPSSFINNDSSAMHH
ncbi:MAG: hypothetical protein IPH18_18100 [Chitinophagaceae bacterium]|nr:hypothetical protein [Chitinophagaceae bacterium]